MPAARAAHRAQLRRQSLTLGQAERGSILRVTLSSTSTGRRFRSI